MPSYPTPAGVRPAPGAPLSLPNLSELLRGRSIARMLDIVWVPLASGLLIILAGAVGYWLKQPWLFAALGPTVLMVVGNPGHETTRFRAVAVGHLAAIACAFLALLIVDAAAAPQLSKAVSAVSPRVWASAGAIALLAVVQQQLKAWHPPAAATALLITLGAYKMTGKVPLALMGSVILIAVAAELLHRLRAKVSR